MPEVRPLGCCPVCDRPVARTWLHAGPRPVEVYACPQHGSIAYGPQAATLRAWIDQQVALDSVAMQVMIDA